MKLLCIPVLVLLITGSYGFRYGSPQDACLSMFPSAHGYDAKSGNVPFSITVNKNHYAPNDTISVMSRRFHVFLDEPVLSIKRLGQGHINVTPPALSLEPAIFVFPVTVSSDAKDPENATRDWFMEGILVQARLADCSSPAPIGTFTVPDCDDFLQVIDCSGLKMSAVRHYTHLHITTKTFTWKAPAAPAGNVYITATIARNRYRFWMGVQSQVIMDDAGGPAPKTCSYQTKYVAPNDTSGASFHHISVLAILFVVFNIFMFA